MIAVRVTSRTYTNSVQAQDRNHDRPKDDNLQFVLDPTKFLWMVPIREALRAYTMNMWEYNGSFAVELVKLSIDRFLLAPQRENSISYLGPSPLKFRDFNACLWIPLSKV